MPTRGAPGSSRPTVGNTKVPAPARWGQRALRCATTMVPARGRTHRCAPTVKYDGAYLTDKSKFEIRVKKDICSIGLADVL